MSAPVYELKVLGALFDVVAAFRDVFWASWGSLGSLLGRSWAVLGRNWVVLGRLLGHFDF